MLGRFSLKGRRKSAHTGPGNSSRKSCPVWPRLASCGQHPPAPTAPWVPTHNRVSKHCIFVVIFLISLNSFIFLPFFVFKEVHVRDFVSVYPWNLCVVSSRSLIF